MQGARPYKRRPLNLAVNQQLQYHLISRVVLILLLCLLLSSSIYFYFANQKIAASFQLFHIRAQSFLDFLLPVIIGAFLISLLTGVVASLFVPKNYAGSLYRLEQDLQHILQGDLTRRIVLRKGDAASGLAEQLNALVGGYRQRLAHVGDLLARAQQLDREGEASPWVIEVKLEQIQILHRQLLQDVQGSKSAPTIPGNRRPADAGDDQDTRP